MIRQALLLIFIIVSEQKIMSMDVLGRSVFSLGSVDIIALDIDLSGTNSLLRTSSTHAFLYGNPKKRKKLYCMMDVFLYHHKKKCELLTSADYQKVLEHYSSTKNKKMFKHILKHESNNNRLERIALYECLQDYYGGTKIDIQKLLKKKKEIVIHSLAYDLKGSINTVKDATPPLFSAIVANNKAQLCALIALGANVNLVYEGVKPLHMAAFEGNKEIATILIANGALVNGLDCNGFSPLQWTIVHGQNEMFEYLNSLTSLKNIL